MLASFLKIIMLSHEMPSRDAKAAAAGKTEVKVSKDSAISGNMRRY